MTLDTLAAAWATEPEFTDDRSNDYAERSMDESAAAERNARKVRGMLASCGTCDRILDTGRKRDVQHVVKCAADNAPYTYR